MVTDRGLHELSGVDGLSYEDLFSYQNTMDSSSSSSPQNTLNAHKLGRKNPNNSNSYPISGSSSNGNNRNNSNSSASHESDSPEDSDMFSDIVLSYISRMLMEEDVDEKINSFYQEKSAIQAAEKPFYDILGEEYPPPSPVPRILDALESPGESWVLDSSEKNRFFDPSAAVPDLLIDSQSACQFKRGMEEARKFLPSESKLVVDLGYDQNEKPPIIRSRGKKNTQIEDLDLQEGRSIKQSAVSSDDVVVRSQMFDDVLLCQGAKKTCASAYKTNDQRGSSQKGSSKGRRKKQQKKDVVDLRTLLIHCAQSVAADDRRNSNDLLNQIRQYSSPYGDGTQRLAHCFADGLEARLAGTGSQIYHSLVAKRTTATDTLKAYRLYLSACPFKKISHFFSNQTILNASENRSTVHIIDFGIYFGFQWPCLIQRLSNRPGGPPKLRITGIDVPQPGFRPTERIEETGKRLADYAKSFDVPFEFNAIASKWETIRVEDLKVEEHEVLIVNCLYRFRNLVDETVVADSPRNKVLGMIRKANPDVFIHGIVNGSYSAPFFVTRFREALFHFSALFDMLENTVPREDAQRLLIERDLFGREALNVVSCEGSQRVERPETHKQWQVRNLRAGFTQLPLNPEIMKRAKDKVRASYHRDFVIDEDSRWLLQGWKGRIIYAISAWKPSEKW